MPGRRAQSPKPQPTARFADAALATNLIANLVIAWGSKTLMVERALYAYPSNLTLFGQTSVGIGFHLNLYGTVEFRSDIVRTSFSRHRLSPEPLRDGRVDVGNIMSGISFKSDTVRTSFSRHRLSPEPRYSVRSSRLIASGFRSASSPPPSYSLTLWSTCKAKKYQGFRSVRPSYQFLYNRFRFASFRHFRLYDGLWAASRAVPSRTPRTASLRCRLMRSSQLPMSSQ